MKVAQRRKEITLYLLSANAPVSGSELAEKFNVSRQIIVQDISVLKATGCDIISTNCGYIIQKSPFAERVFKVKHSSDQTHEELDSIVSLGGAVVDVFVWHKVYGKISANLGIYSKEHVDKYVEGVRIGKSSELMHVTGGYHYHTVRAESESVLDNIKAVLEQKQFLATGD